MYWDFPPQMLIYLFLQKCISNHDTKESSLFFRANRVLASHPTFKKIQALYYMIDAFIILFSYIHIVICILHRFCSVLTCDILGCEENNLFKCEDETITYISINCVKVWVVLLKVLRVIVIMQWQQAYAKNKYPKKPGPKTGHASYN